MYRLCVNVYCHRVTTQLQLTNISYHISFAIKRKIFCSCSDSNTRPSIPQPSHYTHWAIPASSSMLNFHLFVLRILPKSSISRTPFTNMDSFVYNTLQFTSEHVIFTRTKPKEVKINFNNQISRTAHFPCTWSKCLSVCRHVIACSLQVTYEAFHIFFSHCIWIPGSYLELVNRIILHNWLITIARYWAPQRYENINKRARTRGRRGKQLQDNLKKKRMEHERLCTVLHSPKNSRCHRKEYVMNVCF